MLKNLGKDLNKKIKVVENNGIKQLTPLTKKPDFYFTRTASLSLCCIAAQTGLLNGCNSYSYKASICGNNHSIGFIDNLYSKPYDHEKHRNVVALCRPKYATVRDMMTINQCMRDDIVYYPPEKILNWAEDLDAVTENVIVIPKSIEYLDLIPEKFVIGLPVPSSHGSDVLPLECYKGRRVHLLGGSWAKQLSYLFALGDDVISIDNNWIALMANKRFYCDPAGQTHSINDTLNFSLNRAMHVCFTLSCSSIATALDNILISSK